MTPSLRAFRRFLPALCIATQLAVAAYASEPADAETRRVSAAEILRASLETPPDPSVRDRIVDDIRDRSPAAGTVIGMFVLRPDNGFHVDADIGDKGVVLEWNARF